MAVQDVGAAVKLHGAALHAGGEGAAAVVEEGDGHVRVDAVGGEGAGAGEGVDGLRPGGGRVHHLDGLAAIRGVGRGDAVGGRGEHRAGVALVVRREREVIAARVVRGHGPAAFDHRAHQIGVSLIVGDAERGRVLVHSHEVHEGDAQLAGAELGEIVGAVAVVIHDGRAAGGVDHAALVHVVVEVLAVEAALANLLAVPVKEGDGVGRGALGGLHAVGSLLGAVGVAGVVVLCLLDSVGAGEVLAVVAEPGVEHGPQHGVLFVEVEDEAEVTVARLGEGVAVIAAREHLQRGAGDGRGALPGLRSGLGAGFGLLAGGGALLGGRLPAAGGEGEHKAEREQQRCQFADVLHFVSSCIPVFSATKRPGAQPLTAPCAMPFSSRRMKSGNIMMMGNVARMMTLYCIR